MKRFFFAFVLVVLASCGNDEPVDFTVGPGEGLIDHVNFQTAIDIADRFDLPLYRGKAQVAENQIPPEEARALEDETDRVQVTVAVYEGDRFILNGDTWEFIPAPDAPLVRR